MEQQSPTPRRPDDVKADAAPSGPPAPQAAGDSRSEPPSAPPADAKPLTPMGWLQQNSIHLIIALASLWVVYYNWGFDGVYRAALVVLGLGFVIFIHELGHFLAAKWCNVHVQAFSLGFGPALPGCSYTWGETTYKICILPLGGYVQMVGEGADADEDETYPRSYKNKSVPQRMLIISAGVFMNVVLGFVCFVIVYQFHGVETPPAAVAATEPGSPAWVKGVPTGSVFTRIGSAVDPTFDDLQDNFTFSWWETAVPVEYKTHDGQTRQTTLLPRHDANDVQPVIGVSSSPSKMVLLPKKYLDVLDLDRPARLNSPAAAARAMNLRPGDVVVKASDPDRDGDAVTDLGHDLGKKTFDAAELCRRMRGLGDRELVLQVVRDGGAPEEVHVPARGFEADDVVEGVTDPDHPDEPFQVKTLKPKPGGATDNDYDFYDYQERMKLLAGRPAVVRVLRESKVNEAVTSSLVNVLVPPAFHETLGLRMKMGDVAAVRDASPATGKVRPGDRIVAAKVREGDRSLGEIAEGALDPVRLPYDLERAVDGAADRSKVRVVLTVSRKDADTHEDANTDVTLDWDDRWRFDQEVPFNPASPMAVPELGVAYHVESNIVEVQPTRAAFPVASASVMGLLASPAGPGGLLAGPGLLIESPGAAAGLQPNDRITDICFEEAQKTGPGKWGYWFKMEAWRTRGGANQEVPDEWPHYFFIGLQPGDAAGVKVKVWRNGAELPDEIEMTAVEDRTWPMADRGLVLTPDLKLQKADNIFQAAGMGLHYTGSFIRKLYQGMVSMATGRIDATKNVAGPVKIAEQTFQAAQDPFTLIQILGLISVNLAVVNFLPIPVLDGGHMVFLIYELVRRKPPSDAVRAVASYVGLALLATLMLFVVYLDISHWIWGGGR